MANNYGAIHMPKIVEYEGGGDHRGSRLFPAKNGAAFYMGQFVCLVYGAAGSEVAPQFGVSPFIDDGNIYGFVDGFVAVNGNLPIQDYAQRAGTVTDATGELPMKYTFSSSNDESVGVSSAKNELVSITPIFPGDILEVSLWGASTAAVARGTTNAVSTLNSSASFGVAMSVNATYPFAVTESTSNGTLANLDFLTVSIRDKRPLNSKRVFVQPIRSFGSFYNAQ